jgi:phosphatidylserine decarboxylase
VAGRLTDVRYHEGKFFNASLDKASKDNERCACLLVDEEKKLWAMVQIAGLVARRIVFRAEVGDELMRGERFGLIRFGSRVDLYLPDGYSAAVRIGDLVIAGQTVLAKKDS